jgi:hypothetical protein
MTTKTKTKAQKISKGFQLPKTPVRTEVNPEAAETFEGGRPTPKTKGVPKKASAGRTRRNISVAELERINAHVPVKVATELRVRCATDRISLSDAVTQALTQWLEPAKVKHQ